MPEFSVIIPVCHGGNFLTQAMATLAHVTSPSGGFEVIIAGDKKEIGDLSVFNSGQAELRIVEGKGNRSEILNAACAVARGSIWSFADDDCIIPADWILNIERSLIGNPSVTVLGGPDMLAPGAGVFDLALDEVLNSFAGTGGIRRCRCVKAGRYYPKLWNMTVHAAAAQKAALRTANRVMIFDESLSVHEDVDLIKRILARAGKVLYEPDVRVEHCRDTNFTSFFKRNMCMAQICRQRGIHRGAHLALVAIVFGIPAMGIASLVVPTLKTIFVFMAAAYGVALGLVSVKGAVKKKRAVLVGLIPSLMTALHVARAAGYMLPVHIEVDYRK